MASHRSYGKSSQQANLSGAYDTANESNSTRSGPTPSKRGRTTNIFADLFSRASNSQTRVIAPSLLLGNRSQPPPAPAPSTPEPTSSSSSSPKVAPQLPQNSSSVSRAASPRPAASQSHARSSSPKTTSSSSQSQPQENSRSSSPKPTTQYHSHGSGRRGGHNGSFPTGPTSSTAGVRSPVPRGGAAGGKRGGSTRGGGARRRGAKGRRTTVFKNNPLVFD